MLKNTIGIVALVLISTFAGYAQTATQIFDQAKTDYTAQRYEAAATGFASCIGFMTLA